MNLDYYENELLESIVDKLTEKHYTITTAESCTGGLLSSVLVNVAGVSDVFKEGYITYSNEAKEKILGVSRQSLDNFTAVSEQVAYEMVCGAARVANADVAVSVTGVAGPGPSEGNPEGLVYIGVFCKGRIKVEGYNFTGGRQKIREQSVLTALSLIWNLLSDL
ncbi:MAG: CinA family protein [Eubacterium sp.]|nr:CinA family protein [Eubacterium sp.]